MRYTNLNRYYKQSICSQGLQGQFMSSKKLDFFKKCEIMQVANKEHNISTINEEYVFVRFSQLYKTYENLYNSKKGSQAQLQQLRAQIIARLCLISYEHLQRALSSKLPQKKQLFEELANFVDKLAIQKCIRRAMVLNILGATRRKLDFYKQLMQN